MHIARHRAGRNLAKKVLLMQILLSSPRFGNSFCYGIFWESGIPYGLGLIKNRYVGNIYFTKSKDREIEVKIKLNAMREVIEGKRI